MNDVAVTDVLNRLGIEDAHPGVYSNGQWLRSSGTTVAAENPARAESLATIQGGTREDYERTVEAAGKAFLQWRQMPPPARGEVIRKLGNALRHHKADLGLLVTLETGKILAEGAGEVQEMIDMCDFSVGLSRQLYGLTIASERPHHRMFEQWHPLGPTGIITAFNFPVAVWAWNATLAGVCGNSSIWKPSPHAPLTALAVQKIVQEVTDEHELNGVFNLFIAAGNKPGQWMAADRRLPLISATGSCAMGRSVAGTVAGRLGRSLLELGGNNAIIISDSANLELALRAVLFAAVGTTGQRCTSLRRLFLHRSIAAEFTDRLVAAYQSIRIGDPWQPDVLVGPLINQSAVDQMQSALQQAQQQGGKLLTGGKRLDRAGYFVEPAIVQAEAALPIVQQETFAPLLYVITYDTLDDAIAAHNRVDQGLSSAIFTDRLREAEQFLSPSGSDCGIANVNIGTSGAEIGGAFGGEKDTGGGREAGSDAWKTYMRRQTCTINYGNDLPLAQGIRFGD